MQPAFEFPRPGDRFESFDVLEVIGRGSFAHVYKVRSPGHPEPVALKLTALPNMEVDLVQRAIREIAVLRALSSPHVVKLHGSCIGQGYFYLIMELLAGQPLSQFHPLGEPMDPAVAVDVALQICVGLAEAHAKGVVHRDLKPANIWRQPDGTIKLLDFGLARAWGVPWVYGRNATAARTVVGTPHYCQPEQLHTDRLSPASDIYSLATLLYELLSGQAVLFADRGIATVIEDLREDPVAWLDAHATQAPVPITRYPIGAALPDALVSLLEWSLRKEPTERPQLAGQVASRLGDILVHDLQAAPPATVTVRRSHGTREHQLLPGRRRVGAGEVCAVQIVGADLLDVHAHIEWSGSPRHAQIRPAAPGAPVAINGRPVQHVATITERDEISLGAVCMQVHYPTSHA